METKNPYRVDKAMHHEGIVDAIRGHRTHTLAPTLVHVMPQNLCNHDCIFCSYRLSGWRNSQLFDDKQSIPWEIMKGMIEDFVEMGVKAVEITGGGEPTLYAHFDDMMRLLADTQLDVSLVTNGSGLTDARADLLFRTNLKWARVSIDAGDREMHKRVHRTPDGHWQKAWAAVDRLVGRKSDDEQKLGVGFVTTDQNYDGVYRCSMLAKEHGADNIRLSIAFTPQMSRIVNENQLAVALEQGDHAKEDFNGPDFIVVHLIGERHQNLVVGETTGQDYPYCVTKDVIGLVEGNCDLYTCCTLAHSPEGLVGSFRNKRFKDLWEEHAEWRQEHDPREICKCQCLYEARNLSALALDGIPIQDIQLKVKAAGPPLHKNFI